MTNNRRRYFAIRAAKARKAQAAPAPQPTKSTLILPGDAVEVVIDLQSASLNHGKTRAGKAFATFKEPGLPVIMGFGKVADAMIAERYARGLGIRKGGLIRVLAIQSPKGLVDEHGRTCARNAA